MSPSSLAEIDANQLGRCPHYFTLQSLDLPQAKSNANQWPMARPLSNSGNKSSAPDSFEFCGQSFHLMPSNAVYWREENALLVADLHLEKASFYAEVGQMLPPYDSLETLERLAKSVAETGADRVITLGDNFHDAEGADRLESCAAELLASLTSLLNWTWITGNHDDQGEQAGELEVSGIILRHEAAAGERRPEVSGHFHPRFQTKIRGRHIRRPCIVISENRMILPAFGALTGGMDAADSAIITALQPARAIHALVASKQKIARFPLWTGPEEPLQA